MKINIFQWRYSPFLILGSLLLPINYAEAAVTCTASINDANLGDITPANADNESIVATLK